MLPLVATDAAPQRPSPASILLAMAGERMQTDFKLFCQRAWYQVVPTAPIWNWHLDAICEHLMLVSKGEIRFLAISVPPRHTKTVISSILWPVWHWLQNPAEQFLGASVDENLALDSARQSRRLIESAWFKQFWPERVKLLPDENQARMYRNTEGGYRISTSTTGRVTGYGGSIQILDDPHDAKKVESDAVRQAALAWHDNAWRSRLNDPRTARKVYIAQRTHDNDIIGHVLAQEGKRWVNLVLPLQYDSTRPCITFPNKGKGVEPDAKPIFKDPRAVDGEMLDPKRFDAETAKAEEEIMSARAWAAQYQQQPEGQGGLILKKHWWQPWVWPDWHTQFGTDRPLPIFSEIIQVYDTAFEEDEEADFTARTSWGIFSHQTSLRDIRTGNMREGPLRICMMLLDQLEQRLEYPELRDEVIQSNDDFAPDWILVEKKASGHSLIQELRRKHIPIKAVTLAGSGRGRASADLIARAHESSLMLAKGCVFYVPRPWSFKVIDHCAKFPNGDHDDLTSTCTIAWQYARRFYDLTLPDDEKEGEISPFAWHQRARRYA